MDITNLLYPIDIFLDFQNRLAGKGRQTVIAISTDIRVLHLGISGSLSKVHAVRKVVSDTAVGNGQVLGIFHLIRFHIVSYPDSALKMLNPEVMQLGILSQNAGDSLVICLLMKTGL